MSKRGPLSFLWSERGAPKNFRDIFFFLFSFSFSSSFFFFFFFALGPARKSFCKRSLKGSRIGRSDKVSLWCVALLTLDFAFSF